VLQTTSQREVPASDTFLPPSLPATPWDGTGEGYDAAAGSRVPAPAGPYDHDSLWQRIDAGLDDALASATPAEVAAWAPKFRTVAA
jgi:hypothetical protein